MCLERSCLLHSNELLTRDDLPVTHIRSWVAVCLAVLPARLPAALDFPGTGSRVRTSLSGTRVSCAHSCRLAFDGCCDSPLRPWRRLWRGRVPLGAVPLHALKSHGPRSTWCGRVR